MYSRSLIFSAIISFLSQSFEHISKNVSLSSLTLEKFLKFNFINHKKAKCDFDINKRYKTIFTIFNVQNILELENVIIEIKKKAKLESNFVKLKINLKNNIDKLLNGINLQRLKNNPVDLNNKDVKTILLQSN